MLHGQFSSSKWFFFLKMLLVEVFDFLNNWKDKLSKKPFDIVDYFFQTIYNFSRYNVKEVIYLYFI